jgi:transcriptional regulator with XRE-family HTH domain
VNKIERVRKRKNLSYGGLAKLTGLSTTYIFMLATGKRTNPSLTVMKKIADALDSKIEALF